MVEPADRGMRGDQRGQFGLRLVRGCRATIPVGMQFRDPSSVGMLEFLQTAIRTETQLRIHQQEIRFHRGPLQHRHRNALPVPVACRRNWPPIRSVSVVFPVPQRDRRRGRRPCIPRKSTGDRRVGAIAGSRMRLRATRSPPRSGRYRPRRSGGLTSSASSRTLAQGFHQSDGKFHEPGHGARCSR